MLLFSLGLRTARLPGICRRPGFKSDFRIFSKQFSNPASRISRPFSILPITNSSHPRSLITSASPQNDVTNRVYSHPPVKLDSSSESKLSDIKRRPVCLSSHCFSSLFPNIAAFVQDGFYSFSSDRDPSLFGVLLVDRSMREKFHIVSYEIKQLDDEYLRKSVRSATQKRRKLEEKGWFKMKSDSAFRLVNGAEDGLPYLTIDIYAGHAFVVVYSAHWLPTLSTVASACLANIDFVKNVHVQTRIRGGLAQQIPSVAGGKECNSAANALVFKAERDASDELSQKVANNLQQQERIYNHLIGDQNPDNLIVTESDVQFNVRLKENPLTTGLYLDQCDNRKKLTQQVIELVRDHDCDSVTILSTFAHTCAFSLAISAMIRKLGYRVQSVNIDTSIDVLEWGKRNFTLNQFSVDGQQDHQLVKEDVFSVLPKYLDNNQKFDIVILDPPPVSFHTRVGIFNTSKHYEKLVSMAAPLVKKPGLLACFSTVQNQKRRAWIKKVFEGISHPQNGKKERHSEWRVLEYLEEARHFHPNEKKTRVRSRFKGVVLKHFAS
ncbi:putative ribosomal RNA large subunit methyltransferase YwbD [Schistocerca gregaria]|uniref:putative ribosomal RNA large subunit methyltransferase YwbD n=1 Tax=Schistocerca gregaria TaxID=7010 RepID=UPI00211E129F|nr:putative ribosomal RNA large subunit methyltransferase YwbD [Schistocerca gregaria]